MSMPELEQRMESLEMRLMHLEAALDEMTRSLLRQEQLTRTQAETIKRIEEQLRGLAAGYPATPEAEPPPPHY
ncbi:MAG: SlyX family protein [Gammaproteobacteria bacterium]